MQLFTTATIFLVLASGITARTNCQAYCRESPDGITCYDGQVRTRDGFVMTSDCVYLLAYLFSFFAFTA